MLLLLVMLLMLRRYNSDGWRLQGEASMLMVVSCRPWRLIEQNKVLLWQWRSLLLRGCCRQAGGTGGKPC